MPIQIIPGDLLVALRNGEVNVIGHCANMQNTFGSGIAKSIREQFPKAYEADTKWFGTPDFLRAQHSAAYVHEGAVFNLYGQVNYGREKRQVHYRLLAKALFEMSRHCLKSDIVGFPYLMGCDRAGGDWEVVHELIEAAFSRCEVRIYKLDKAI